MGTKVILSISKLLDNITISLLFILLLSCENINQGSIVEMKFLNLRIESFNF